LIIPIANVHHSRKAFTPIPSVGIVCTGRGSQAIRRPVGLRIPYPEMGFVSVSWSSARWRLATGRERCSWDVFSFHDEAFASSFEHRKREGCAILVASCSGALCQPLLEKGLAKDQLLETEPDATRSGMAIETGEPIPLVTAAFFRMRPQTQGVRAIPAVHDVYPVG
jgi:hypothetical protein